MSNIQEKYNFGWVRDLPDFRDYSIEQDDIKSMLKKLKVLAPTSDLPEKVNLKPWCSPIEDQGALGSCTANAGVGMIEFYENKAFGEHLNASKLFLYKVTRNLLGWTGDTGAYLRSTMGAMALFGVPPEKYWPYDISKFDVEPSAFLYAFGQSYQAISYSRLDPSGTQPEKLLERIKTNLAANMPSMFGFTVYDSIRQANGAGKGKIQFPCATDRAQGGHAIVAVGYDDKLKIKNSNCHSSTTGAFLIRNSWSSDWGDEGYGWLPYEYVLQGLAVDWWSLIKKDYIYTKAFGL